MGDLLALRAKGTIPDSKVAMSQEKEHVDAVKHLHTKVLEIIDAVTRKIVMHR